MPFREGRHRMKKGSMGTTAGRGEFLMPPKSKSNMVRERDKGVVMCMGHEGVEETR